MQSVVAFRFPHGTEYRAIGADAVPKVGTTFRSSGKEWTVVDVKVTAYARQDIHLVPRAEATTGTGNVRSKVMYLLLAPVLILLAWVIFESVTPMGSPRPDLLIASVALIVGIGVLASAALAALTLRVLG